jgi:hypothetical protein
MKLLYVLLVALLAFTYAQEKTPLCQPCILGVQLVKDFANKPDEELIQLLVTQCDRLPEVGRGPCRLALSLVGKQIITYVRRNLQEPNRAICNKFKLCRTPFEKLSQDGVLCTPCQLAVNLIKDYSTKPDEELLALLIKGCNSLPEAVQAPCKMAVTLVGGQLIAYVRTHLRESPRQICAKFRMCAATEESIEKQDSPLCAPCQLGVQLVKDYINRPDEELLRMLMNGCNALPEQLQAPCKMAITLVGGQMLAYIRTHLTETPRQICAKFRLCGAAMEVAVQDGPLCTPCQLAVNLVKDYLSKPDEELLRILMNGCNGLPEQFQAPCKMAVSLAGGQALAFLRAQVSGSPREICAKFGACGAAEAAEKNKFTCILKCLGSGWSLPRVIGLVKKCKTNKVCYVKEVGQVAAECAMGCL